MKDAICVNVNGRHQVIRQDGYILECCKGNVYVMDIQDKASNHSEELILCETKLKEQKQHNQELQQELLKLKDELTHIRSKKEPEQPDYETIEQMIQSVKERVDEDRYISTMLEKEHSEDITIEEMFRNIQEELDMVEKKMAAQICGQEEEESRIQDAIVIRKNKGRVVVLSEEEKQETCE